MNHYSSKYVGFDYQYQSIQQNSIHIMAEGTNCCACFVRVMNFVTGLMLIGFGIVGLVFIVTDLASLKFFLIFSPIYMIIFGMIVLSFQLKIKFLRDYFSFLDCMIGRGIFNIYMSSSVYYYFACQVGSDVLAWIFGTLVFCTGIVYFVLHCTGHVVETDTKEQMM